MLMLEGKKKTPNFVHLPRTSVARSLSLCCHILPVSLSLEASLTQVILWRKLQEVWEHLWALSVESDALTPKSQNKAKKSFLSKNGQASTLLCKLSPKLNPKCDKSSKEGRYISQYQKDYPLNKKGNLHWETP